MMWDEVMERVLARLKENDTLSGLFGDDFRMASAGAKLKVPSLEYTILTDTTSELMEPFLVQFDIWTEKAADNRTAERIVRSLLHQRTSTRWDDVALIADYMDGSFLATPDRANFIGRGLRFRFMPLKQQYSLPAV
jgi:hypothetical protein